MVKVWVSTTRPGAHVRFHARASCSLAQRMRKHPLLEVDLDEIINPDPCRGCYPGVPRAPEVWRPRCDICYGPTLEPCEHNGGVLAWVPQRGRWPGKLGYGTFDPDVTWYRRSYVWPENAYRYRSAEETPGDPSNPRSPADQRDHQHR